VIWGCDIGTRKIALSCPDVVRLAAVELPKLRAREIEDRVQDLERLSDFVREHVPPDSSLWVEKPVPNPKVSGLTAIHMGMVVGALARGHLGSTFLVLPHVWKKEVTGVGNLGKPAIRQWLIDHHPALAAACEDNQDLVDATCVGLFGGTPAARELEKAWRLQRS
jgi:hypothetical protein